MRHEKKLISHIADRLWGEGNKYWISLHERREIEIWIGVANACQCSRLFCIWRMKCIFRVCVRVCACVCVWLMQTCRYWMDFHLSYFPITTLEQERHRWSECFKREKVILKMSRAALRSNTPPHPLLLSWGQTRASSLAICHLDVLKSCMHAGFGPASWTGQVPRSLPGCAATTRDPAKLSEYELTTTSLVKSVSAPKLTSNFADVIWRSSLEDGFSTSSSSVRAEMLFLSLKDPFLKTAVSVNLIESLNSNLCRALKTC